MAVGYIGTSSFSYAGDRGWRYSMLTQILYGTILTILFYSIPKEFINFDPSKYENLDLDLCTCNKSQSTTMDVDTDKSVCLTGSGDDLPNSQDYVLKRYRSLDFVSKVSSLGITNKQHILRTRSSFDGSFNKSEYSKCTKCFITNVKLYQETMSVKNLSAWSKFKMLAKNNIFILTCVSISTIYFGYWDLLLDDKNSNLNL